MRAILDEHPWVTGQMLMREAEPATLQRMLRLYLACPKNAPTKLRIVTLSAMR